MSVLCPDCLKAGRKNSRGGLIKLARGTYCVVCGYHTDREVMTNKEALKLRARNAAISRKDYAALREDELFGEAG